MSLCDEARASCFDSRPIPGDLANAPYQDNCDWIEADPCDCVPRYARPRPSDDENRAHLHNEHPDGLAEVILGQLLDCNANKENPEA
jgi:hypothetical protein